MPTTSLSSEAFTQDIARAKQAAGDGPVFITEGGEPSHVLLTIADYRALTRDNANIVELLSMRPAVDIDFEPPRMGGDLVRPVDLS